MATTTSNVQTLVRDALSDNEFFSDNNITIISETACDTPNAFEAAMADPGCCVIIGKPSYSRSSGGGVNISVPVEVFENVTINQGTGGTGKGIDEIAETVWASCEMYTNPLFPQFSKLIPQTLDHDLVDLGTLVATITVNTFSGVSITNI